MAATHPTLWTYGKTWLLLMLLLFVTVTVAHFDLGGAALPIAMAIAIVKAVLILLIFMHIHYSKGDVVVFACAAYLWMAIMIIGTMHDYFSRNWVPGPVTTKAVSLSSKP